VIRGEHLHEFIKFLLVREEVSRELRIAWAVTLINIMGIINGKCWYTQHQSNYGANYRPRSRASRVCHFSSTLRSALSAIFPPLVIFH
jgi:hypothetical protein